MLTAAGQKKEVTKLMSKVFGPDIASVIMKFYEYTECGPLSKLADVIEDKNSTMERMYIEFGERSESWSGYGVKYITGDITHYLSIDCINETINCLIRKLPMDEAKSLDREIVMLKAIRATNKLVHEIMAETNVPFTDRRNRIINSRIQMEDIKLLEDVKLDE